ncbi:MAG: hypothetical protein QOE19_2177 [Actinomycetota bacterium]|nr:hypothetical protein [Actinomycetota bacterium]
MDFDEVADELFGLPPSDFVRERDARAKAARAAGDGELARRITELRKPTNVAWLANQLARKRPEQVGPFLALGESLREATSALSGPDLRELARQRQQLVHALVQEARRLPTDGGPRVSEEVARGLEETLHAALADPAGAELLAAGRLSSGLQHSGFGGPPAAPSPPPPVKKAPARRKGRGKDDAAAQAQRRAAERQEVEQALSSAWAQARSAAEAREAAAGAAAAAKTSYDAAAARVAELEGQLQEVQLALAAAVADKDTALEARGTADEEHEEAERSADAGRKVVTDLQARLDRL